LWSQCGSESRRYPLEVLPVSGGLRETLDSARFGHRFVVIDCPPATNAESSGLAIDSADVVLVPVLPSPMDLWASSGIEEMITRARARNQSLRAYLVLNQVEMRNAMSRDIEVVLREFSVPALRSGLTRRAIYRTAALEGCSVYELGLNGRHATTEIENIVDEVLQS
jgi:chromosome partitioning protein